jgi:hypothetical protein
MRHRILRAAALAFATIAVLTAVSADARAQCAFGAQEFANVGGGPIPDKVRIDPNGAENKGNQVARFWQSDNALLGNNFGGLCESDDRAGSFGPWWQFSQAPLRGIRGAVAGLGCTASSCPTNELTFVVEERGANPAEAFFIGFRIDETPGGVPDGGNRWWNLSRVDPSPSPSVLTMLPFPVPEIVDSTAEGFDVTLDLRLPDVAPNVHAVNDPFNDIPLPPSSVVASYDLYISSETNDPGRSVDDWNLFTTVDYNDVAPETTVTVTCPNDGTVLRLALGLTFDGGVAHGVVSALVGRAIEAPCGQPTANAGDDVAMECSGADGTPIMLDGSASTNAGDYLWEAPGVVFDDPTSSMPTGLFPVGLTTVTLTVSNEKGENVDTLDVSVADTTPPQIVCSVAPVAFSNGLTPVAGAFLDEDEDEDSDEGDDEGGDGGDGECPDGGDGELPTGEVLTLSFAGSDSCGGVALDGWVDAGWGLIDTQDGTTLDMVCLADGNGCGVSNACSGMPQIRSNDVLLVATATDEAGNVISCSVDLCDPALEPTVRIEALANGVTGGMQQLTLENHGAGPAEETPAPARRGKVSRKRLRDPR